MSTDSVAAFPRIGTKVRRRYSALWPYLNWAIFAIGAVYCIASIMGLTGWPDGGDGIVAGDAWNYWQGTPYTDMHYRYSPAFYWATLPLRALPWEVFITLWTTAHLVALAWLGPWTILLAFDDVIRGNVTTFLAVALVISLHRPRSSSRHRLPIRPKSTDRRRRLHLPLHAAAWCFPILTKVTPGVGVLWHVPRREWADLAIALGTTAAVVAVGTLIDPQLWLGWFDSLRAGTENYQTINVLAPLPVRVAAGAVLCLLAARWVWLLPVGMVLAMPGLLPSSFALLAAIPRIRSPR